MSLGVTEAARRLDLTPRRVRALIASGALRAEKIGATYVVQDRDVDVFAGVSRAKHVRSMSPRIAWAAAALLDGVGPTWLRADELSRLRARLRGSAQISHWRPQTMKVATVRATFRGGPGQVSDLLEHPVTVRTGRSASNFVTDPLVGVVGASVWVLTAGTVIELRKSLGLLPSANGNITIAVPSVPNLPQLGGDGENAFRLIVATDLLREDDSRAQAAGKALLAVLSKQGQEDRG